MQVQRASLDIIQDFLAQKRIALVGASRKANDFSSILFKELSQRGYEVVPVNPNVQQIMGRRCYSRVQEIEPPVDAALLLTSPEVTDRVVEDCIEAGIQRVWMHRAGGPGAVSDRAVEVCRERGIRVIPGECPLMFLSKIGGIHGFHAFLCKLTGRYPRHSHA